VAFRGWQAEAIEFYEGLEADNSKTYWNENRSVYDNLVREPMIELLSELAPEFGEGKLFRPYRDVRFSAIKTPYKTTIAATFESGGYVQLSAAGLGAGSGMYMMASDQLERYRQAVVDEVTGGQLDKLVIALDASGIDVEGTNALKTAPRGYPKDHPRIELLRYRGIFAWKQWEPGAWLGTKSATDRVAKLLRASRPLDAWLAANVGSSELEESRRH
jgi:uncharacterized protein (TIGR02453 family)